MAAEVAAAVTATAVDALRECAAGARQDELRVREGRRSGVGAAHDWPVPQRDRWTSVARAAGAPAPCDGQPQGDQGADRSRLMTGHRHAPRRSEGGRAPAVCRIRAGDAGWIYSPEVFSPGAKTPPPRRCPFAFPRQPLARASLLAGLNDAQQRAAGFGVGGEGGDGAAAAIGPLLIVAGAGSGKTLTLAARVARLVLAGADPSRLLLLTFSRRAALEMERRVGRVLHDALGLAPLQQAPRLAWCGTFHSVGARLLRGVAARIGLDESFTVDDRADSEDLIHLLRQRLGLASGARRFPQKGTCLAIYSRAVNARQAARRRAGRDLSLVPRPRGRAAPPVRRLRRREAGAARPRLRRPARLVGRGDGRSGRRRADRVALRPCARRRVPGHQPPAGRDRPAPAPGRQQPHRRRRRCPGDLLVPRRRGAQHPRLRRLASRRRRPC